MKNESRIMTEAEYIAFLGKETVAQAMRIYSLDEVPALEPTAGGYVRDGLTEAAPGAE